MAPYRRAVAMLAALALFLLPTAATSATPPSNATIGGLRTQPTDDAPVLRLGDVGPAVASVQRQLVLLGADVATDGVYGSSTEEAVLDVQRFFGLRVDGIVGPETRSLIESLLDLVVDVTEIGDFAGGEPPRRVVGYPSEGGYCIEVRAGSDYGTECGPVLPRALEVRDIAVDRDESRTYAAGIVSAEVDQVVLEIAGEPQPFLPDLVELAGTDGAKGFAVPRLAADVEVVRAFDARDEEVATVVREDGVSYLILERGDRGPSVRRWQATLERLGADIPVDGVFGVATERNTRQFQRFFGLRVDGIVGPETSEAAERILALVEQPAPEPPEPPSGPDAELTRCESPEGFSVAHPADWQTNPGDVAPACSLFDPNPFEVPNTDERVAAIAAYVDPVPFATVATPDHLGELQRAPTAIDGRQAVRLQYRSSGRGLWPAGTRITTYAVDLGSTAGEGQQTLILDTVDVGDFDYDANTTVLDRMARTLRLLPQGVPTQESVIARFDGPPPLRVSGEIRDGRACLRVLPDGDARCAPILGERDAHVIQLEGEAIGAVAAGITSEEVFSVTVNRTDGSEFTVLPVDIGESMVRGFAFPFGLDTITRMVAGDIRGDEVATIEPGTDPAPTDPEPIRRSWDFVHGADGWTADVTDFSPATRPDDVVAETGVSPPELGEGTGFFHLAATNRSDDVFQYLRRRIGREAGLHPSTSYDVAVSVQVASNAPSGCVGIGGPPGEAVWLKVGATPEEPVPVTEEGQIRLGIDKGNQSQGGDDAVVAGDIANGIPCEDALAPDEPPFALVDRSATVQNVTTAGDGSLWLLVGTDSGFEGRTSLYYDRIDVALTETAR